MPSAAHTLEVTPWWQPYTRLPASIKREHMRGVAAAAAAAAVALLWLICLPPVHKDLMLATDPAAGGAGISIDSAGAALSGLRVAFDFAKDGGELLQERGEHASAYAPAAAHAHTSQAGS
jgi:hypothetical protein